MRDQKRGQQSDMKWKREERGSLKAYLSNVQGQLSNDECWSHHRLLLNPLLPPLALTIKDEDAFFHKEPLQALVLSYDLMLRYIFFIVGLFALLLFFFFNLADIRFHCERVTVLN